jgi:hypothetical protein
LIEPAFQQQQAQAPTTEQPPAAQPGPGNAQPAAAAAEEAAEAAPQPQPRRKLRQLFDFLVVYDLEATCERDKSKQLTPQASQGCQPVVLARPSLAKLLVTQCLLPLLEAACKTWWSPRVRCLTIHSLQLHLPPF